MLRASATHNSDEIDLRGVGNESIDVGLANARTLSALVEAAVLRDDDEMDVARNKAIEDIGTVGTARAVAVAANFEMMNRLLDAVGIGPPPQMQPIGDLIGVPMPARFAS